MKTCSRCHIPKDSGEFNKCSSTKDGLQSACRLCQKEYKSQYYKANREALIAYVRAYEVAHPGYKAEMDKRWRERNAEHIADYMRQWRSTKHAKEIVRRNASWLAYRARKRNQFIETVKPDVVYETHGGMCGICEQYVAPDDFHVDHIVPLSKGGLHCYANVQPAHPTCNLRKGARI